MKKILFLANHFITLFSFRKELIQTMVSEGNEIFLSLPDSEDNRFFEEMGCHIIPTVIDRRGKNPFKDLALIKQYKKIMREVNPDIVFSYTIKPNVYGCFASKKTGHKQVCNITGTGGTFLKKNFLSFITIRLYKMSVKYCYKVFFQNSGDRDFFLKHKMVGKNFDLLPGSGCDLSSHPFYPFNDDGIMRFIFIGRVMKIKGIDEYLECAKIIKKDYPNTEFIIAGWNEEDKYRSIVEEYQKLGIINYIGFRKDISDWIVKSTCTILPSLGGEGIPNVILESSATGRICIGSNINGTCDVIEDGKTGYLFDAGSTESLVSAVKKVIEMTSDQRNQMGILARKKIVDEFDRQIVIKKYLEELYE